MASSSNKPATQMAVWSMRLLMIASRVAAFFAMRLGRLLIIMLFILLSLYISYNQVWQSITGTAPLPSGVTERSPQLNVQLLQAISSQRQERVEATRQLFNVETLFKPLAGP